MYIYLFLWKNRYSMCLAKNPTYRAIKRYATVCCLLTIIIVLTQEFVKDYEGLISLSNPLVCDVTVKNDNNYDALEYEVFDTRK